MRLPITDNIQIISVLKVINAFNNKLNLLEQVLLTPSTFNFGRKSSFY